MYLYYLSDVSVDVSWQIVSNLPQWGPPIYRTRFTKDPLHGWRCCSQKRVMSRPIQVRQLLNKKVWICDICHKQIHVRKQISIRCNRIEHWVHLRCAGIRQAQYTDTWTCHLHRESRLTTSHRHNITPPLPDPGPSPPLPTPHLHHPHHHNQNTDTCPTLHQHLTSTSPVLDKTPESPVPRTHRNHTSPVPHTSTACHPRTSHSTHTCNTNNSTFITVTATTTRTT